MQTCLKFKGTILGYIVLTVLSSRFRPEQQRFQLFLHSPPTAPPLPPCIGKQRLWQLLIIFPLEKWRLNNHSVPFESYNQLISKAHTYFTPFWICFPTCKCESSKIHCHLIPSNFSMVHLAEGYDKQGTLLFWGGWQTAQWIVWNKEVKTFPYYVFWRNFSLLWQTEKFSRKRWNLENIRITFFTT